MGSPGDTSDKPKRFLSQTDRQSARLTRLEIREAISDLKDDLEEVMIQWELAAAIVGGAYAKAYERFNDAIKDQKTIDDLKTQLWFSIFSCVFAGAVLSNLSQVLQQSTRFPLLVGRIDHFLKDGLKKSARGSPAKTGGKRHASYPGKTPASEETLKEAGVKYLETAEDLLQMGSDKTLDYYRSSLDSGQDIPKMSPAEFGPSIQLFTTSQKKAGLAYIKSLKEKFSLEILETDEKTVTALKGINPIVFKRELAKKKGAFLDPHGMLEVKNLDAKDAKGNNIFQNRLTNLIEAAFWRWWVLAKLQSRKVTLSLHGPGCHPTEGCKTTVLQWDEPGEAICRALKRVGILDKARVPFPVRYGDVPRLVKFCSTFKPESLYKDFTIPKPLRLLVPVKPPSTSKAILPAPRSTAQDLVRQPGGRPGIPNRGDAKRQVKVWGRTVIIRTGRTVIVNP